MKKVLLAAVMLVLVGVAGAAPVLFEAYQEDQIYIPEVEDGKLIVTEVSFSVDSACYVQLVACGNTVYSKSWLVMDNDSLPFVAHGSTSSYWPGWVNLTYITSVEPGEHTVALWVSTVYPDVGPTTFTNGYLQALVFLPDTATGAVAEPPLEARSLSPLPTSIVSRGPFVYVVGATELVDAAGRVIENAIREEKVFISNLSTGTYFARDGERTVVKIVKVE
jgi:hypothetical protein